MDDELHVFSYGSLIEEPSEPQAVRRVRLAWAQDWDRGFHLTSLYRGCPQHLVRYPEIVEPELVVDDLRLSLVLGARPAPGRRIAGAVVSWHDPDDAVRAAIDRREGVDPAAPESGPYLRRTAMVEVEGEAQEVLIYATNPDHPRFVELSVERQARALVHATPRVIDRDRGALYLLPLVGFLRRHGVHDPYIEQLVHHMESLVGALPEPVRRSGPYNGT